MSISRPEFCTELMHLRSVAQNWVKDHLHQAEAAAYKLDFDLSNHHCCQAVEAAKTAADEIEDFIGRNIETVRKVPNLTLNQLEEGHKDFISRVEHAASMVALFALELSITGKVIPEA